MNSLLDSPIPPTAPATPAPTQAQAQVIRRLQESVSPSRLSLFQSCRLKFFFRHVLRLQKTKSVVLHVGTSVHATLKAWNRARWHAQEPTSSSMYTAYDHTWADSQTDEPVAWENAAQEAEQKQVGWRLLETFFRETTIPVQGKPDGVEVAVEADLSAHGLPGLVGVFDLVQDGCIIDFKTTGQTPTPEKAALLHATQGTAYAVLYRQNTGREEKAVEIHHLVKLKQPRLVVITLPPVREGAYTRLLRVVDAYVEGLERRDFIPSPGLQCAACEFIHECSAWPG